MSYNIGYFPSLYNDELLYSVIARYGVHMGHTSLEQTATELFDNPLVHPTVDLPKRMAWLVKRTRLNSFISVQGMIYKHTMFPFYTAFLGEKRRSKVFWAMFGSSFEKNYATNGLGIRSEQLKMDTQKYCPVCLQDDYLNYGEAYWHRIHRAPGVQRCAKHKIPLISNCNVCGEELTLSRNRYKALSVTCTNGHSLATVAPVIENGAVDKLAIGYAEDAALLLERNVAFEPRYLAELYRDRLYELGYEKLPTGRFTGYFGNQFLREMGVPHPDNTDWLTRVFRNEDWNPVHHLLVIRWLFGSLNNLLAGNFDNAMLFPVTGQVDVKEALIQNDLLMKVAA